MTAISKALFTAAVGLALTGTALADDGASPPPPPPPGGGGPGAAGDAGLPPRLWIGGGVELSPLGSISFAAGGMTTTSDAALAYGIDGVAMYAVSPLISIGFAPRYLLGVKVKDSTGDSASMLDLRAIVSAGKVVAPLIHAFGFGGLGYSFIMVPNSSDTNPNASGLTLSFGAGAGYEIGPRMMAMATLGYELGFQSVTLMGQSADVKYNQLSFGAGIMAAIGN